ncbi:hypothetical protein CDAR_596431 [Caerostris darwini]|uniref:Uncharacterized protein n=1 Tax=Caerostris darwini TaxID=1538125 RepID=A0AAV4USC1_9ARAC|nr:hypothetical protein CDAR_596431 [Caerostris darwini]
MNRGKTYKPEKQRNYKTYFAQNNNKNPILSSKAIQHAKSVKGAIRRNFVPIKRCSDRINVCKQIISKKQNCPQLRRGINQKLKINERTHYQSRKPEKSKDRNEVYFRTVFPGKKIQSIFRNIPRKIILRLPGRKQKRVRTIHCRLAGYDIKRKELKDGRSIHVYRLEVERPTQRYPIKRKRNPERRSRENAKEVSNATSLPITRGTLEHIKAWQEISGDFDVSYKAALLNAWKAKCPEIGNIAAQSTPLKVSFATSTSLNTEINYAKTSGFEGQNSFQKDHQYSALKEKTSQLKSSDNGINIRRNSFSQIYLRNSSGVSRFMRSSTFASRDLGEAAMFDREEIMSPNFIKKFGGLSYSHNSPEFGSRKKDNCNILKDLQKQMFMFCKDNNSKDYSEMNLKKTALSESIKVKT